MKGSSQKELPKSEVRGGQEATPCVRGQGQPKEATSHWRPGAATLRSHPQPEPEARGTAGRSHPRQRPGPGGGTRGAVAAQAQEGLEELSHTEGQELRRYGDTPYPR